MLKKIAAIVGVTIGSLFLISSVALATPVSETGSIHKIVGQTDLQKNVCAGIDLAGAGCDQDTGKVKSGGTDLGGTVKNVINILSIVVGAASVIMIIIGGFRYVISGGDSNAVSGAKNTILYAIIGLVIVIFAQVIVRFVFTNATQSAAPKPAVPAKP